MRQHFRICRFILLLGVLLVVTRASAQFMNTETPRWLRLDIPTVSLGVDAEALHEDASMNGSKSTHDYATITPLLGLSTHGSIYHPDLMSFDLSGEGGVGWARDEVHSVGYDLNRNEDRELLRYVARVNFLSAKPYNANFFASQDHTYQNYDFFNTATVDSFRYGGHAGYTTPSLSLNANAGYRDERSATLTGTSEIADTFVDFTGIHTREFGNSTLTYGHDEYSNRLNDGPPLDSVNNYVGISDSETFGSRKQFSATAGLNYSQYQYFDQQTDTLNANGNFTAKHTETLDSFANLNYTRNEQDPIVASVFQGVTGLRHRLYESLTSTVDVHGTYDENSTPNGDAFNDRYGIGVREDYTKRLGSVGRLTMGGGVVADHEDHEAPFSIINVIDEPHALFAPGSAAHPVYLNNPRVIGGTVSVRVGALVAREGFDYRLIPSGELTEIQRIRTSVIIPADGTQVLVSYQSSSLYNASFESLNGFFQVRVDLYNTVGVYGRINWLDNNAPPRVLTETLTDLVGGVDAHWRWFRAGAEYEDFDSNFTQYKAWRFFETFTYQPMEASTVGVEFNQLFYRYPDGRRDTQYQFISRFTSQLNRWLWWNVEAGYFMQDAFGVEQDLAAARTDLSFVRGKLSIKVGYQYNYQLITQSRAEEERNRNFAYLSLRRYF